RAPAPELRDRIAPGVGLGARAHQGPRAGRPVGDPAHPRGALCGMFLGLAFVIVHHPFYSGFYGDRALRHGISPTTDQGIAGAMMIGVDFVVMIAALRFFFLRSATDADRAAIQAPVQDSGVS